MARRRRKGRNINGIILFDKPIKLTSNQALQNVKHLLNANKAGHTGSLDPLATGLLPICLGEATKVSSYLLSADKSYSVRCQLGVRTDSADADGNVIETRVINNISETRIKLVLQQFKGSISQVPPMYSAIKKNGVPLYKLARKGIEIEREPRQISIYDIDLVDFYDNILEFTVSCSKGTYIRTLVDDVGEILGCGAHVTMLRRTRVGPFDVDGLVTWEKLQILQSQGEEAVSQAILPIEEGLKLMPAVTLTEDAAFYLQKGQAVFIPRNKNKGFVRLFMGDNRFLGIGQMQEDGKVAPKRLMNLGKIG